MFVSDAPIAARSCGESADEALQLGEQLGQLVVARVDRAQHRVEVGDRAADHRVAVGQRRGQRRRVGEQRVDVAALALQRLDDLEGERVDVLGVERREQRLEAVEQHGEVERRLGLLQRQRSRPAAVGCDDPAPSLSAT